MGSWTTWNRTLAVFARRRGKLWMPRNVHTPDFRAMESHMEKHRLPAQVSESLLGGTYSLC